jgi:hypothetical protein
MDAKKNEGLHLDIYPELCKLLSGMGGERCGIHNAEVARLCELGALCPDGGDIVEVGSHRGKSTCCLAAGARAAGKKVRVFAVDLWDKGVQTFSHYRSGETWRIFLEQCGRMGFQVFEKRMPEDVQRGNITACKGSSVEISKRRRRGIDVLFIDASHKYPDVLADWQAWGKFVVPGGIVAFHDYGTRFAGVDQVVEEEVKGRGWFEEYRVVDRIFSARKKG